METLFVGGFYVVQSAFQLGLLKEVYVERRYKGEVLGKKVFVLSREEMIQRFHREGEEGIVGKVILPPPLPAEKLIQKSQEERKPLLLLEEVQDPQNLGALARSAYTLGGCGIILTRHRSAERTPSAIRVSLGTLLFLPVAYVGGMGNFLLKIGETFPVYSTSPHEGVPPWEVPLEEGHGWLLGGEEKGVKKISLRRARKIVRIPMEKGESLNVAQAGTILLYESLRARWKRERLSV